MPARRATSVLASLALISASCGAFTVGPDVGSESAAVASLGAWSSDEPGTTVEDIEAALERLHTGLLPAEVTHVARVIVQEAKRADLSPALVLAVVYVESSGYNFARSRVGALGLMQVRPATGAAVARRIGVPWRGSKTLFDAGTNVRLGVTYLGELRDRYGDVPTALAAYNWGPTRISAKIRRGEPVPAGYASRVLEAYGSTTRRAI